MDICMSLLRKTKNGERKTLRISGKFEKVPVRKTGGTSMLLKSCILFLFKYLVLDHLKNHHLFARQIGENDEKNGKPNSQTEREQL